MASNKDLVERFKNNTLIRGNPLRNIRAEAVSTSREILKLTQQHERFAKAMADPRAAQAVARTLAMNTALGKQTSLLRQRLDAASRGQAVVTGAFAKEQRGLQALARDRERVARLERRGAFDSSLYTQQLSLQTRLGAVKDGTHARELKGLRAVAREQERIGQLERRAVFEDRVKREHMSLGSRAAAVKDGTYGREVKALQSVTKEREKIERMERRSALVAEKGRFRGTLAYLGERANESGVGGAAVGLAKYGAGAVAASAYKGFGNTVEMNRFQLEMSMLNREVAGAFVPALRGATRVLQGLRTRMEKLTPGQQDNIMYGGLAVAGGIAAHAALRNTLGVGLGTAATRAGGAFAGMGGLGAMAGGIGLGAGAAAAGYGHEAVGLGALAGGTIASLRGKSFRGGALRAAGPLAAGAAIYEGASGGYYSELRSRGNNKLVSALGGLGGGLMDTLSFGAYGDWFRKKYPNATKDTGANESRRKVTIADAGFDASGSGFERITSKLALNDAGLADKKAEEAEMLTGIVGRIEAMLKEAMDRAKTPQMPPPR